MTLQAFLTATAIAGAALYLIWKIFWASRGPAAKKEPDVSVDRLTRKKGGGSRPSDRGCH